MERLVGESRISPERTAEIATKTQEAIQSFLDMAQKLHYASKVVGELHTLLPSEMCITLPSELHDTLQHKDLNREENNPIIISTPLNSPMNNSSKIKPSNIVMSGIEKQVQINIDAMDNDLIQNEAMSEVEDYDTFRPLPPTQSSLSITQQVIQFTFSKKRRELNQKEKIFHNSYPNFEELKKNALRRPKTPVQARPKIRKNIMHFNAEILPINSQTSSSTFQTSSESEVSVPVHTSQNLANLTITTESSFPNPTNGVKIKNPIKSKNSKTRISHFTAEETALLDEFNRYLEPRLANGDTQTEIVGEILKRYGYSCRISQANISLMARRIAIPKDEKTIAAIRNWIAIEKQS
ncbi:8178_t:CDS:2 [Ambispora gerdemannii]|uniref:8178_t:CDS:1 n=1 Tax=Ambispora gerdemannii TaxID=144530 RepID=A0A9N9CRR6_9GLOM|nr:8178_t:CDS:2 [Ambispora gerdemannii]